VAVDDGSADATGELLEAWRRRDPRVRLAFTPGVGVARALSVAASAAGSALLARMDADDVAHPRRFELQTSFLRSRPDLAACGTGVELFPEEEVGSGYRRYGRWLNELRSPEDLRRDLFVECPIAHPTLVIRASVLRGLGGYRDRGWPEDYDLLLRLHAAGLRAVNLGRVLLRWRVRPGRLSLDAPAYSPASFRRCKVHFLVRGGLPHGRALVVWGAGRVGKPLARELARQGRPARAFVDLDPRRIGQEIHGLPVLPPEGLGRLPGAYVLAAVGAPGAREDIRRTLEAAGRVEITDFRAVA